MKISEGRIKYGKQIKQIVAISSLFFIGIAIGIAAATGAVHLNQNFWDIMKEDTLSKLDKIQWQYYFLYLLLEKGKWYGLLLVFSVTLFALPYLAGCITYKGISIGFFFASLNMEFGWKGVLFGLATLFPQVLVFLPITILYFLYLLQIRREIGMYKHAVGWKGDIKYLGLFILFIVFGCLLEAKINLAVLQSAIILLN